jgi:hypothetical protein
MRAGGSVWLPTIDNQQLIVVGAAAEAPGGWQQLVPPFPSLRPEVPAAPRAERTIVGASSSDTGIRLATSQMGSSLSGGRPSPLLSSAAITSSASTGFAKQSTEAALIAAITAATLP